MNRHETIFSIRYAVRVLERHAALWRWLHGACRVSSLLAGSAAIAALSAQMSGLAITAGIIFALVQAIEFGINPDEISTLSRTERRGYADLMANQAALSDDELLSAYRSLTATDEVIIGDTLREIAYNDVIAEMGLDGTAAYTLSFQHRLARWMA